MPLFSDISLGTRTFSRNDKGADTSRTLRPLLLRFGRDPCSISRAASLLTFFLRAIPDTNKTPKACVPLFPHHLPPRHPSHRKGWVVPYHRSNADKNGVAVPTNAMYFTKEGTLEQINFEEGTAHHTKAGTGRVKITGGG